MQTINGDLVIKECNHFSCRCVNRLKDANVYTYNDLFSFRLVDWVKVYPPIGQKNLQEIAEFLKEYKLTNVKMETALRFSPSENANDLLLFTGTEQYYKNHSMPFMVYTDGVKHLFETRNAYWLGNQISANIKWCTPLRNQPFMSCELITESSEAVLVFTDGNHNILLSEEIPYTDFPDKGVCIWIVDNVIMLPSEY